MQLQGEVNKVTTLPELEKRIEAGLKTFVEVGLCLLEIRDRRLYKEQGYSRFEDYCRERWKFSRIRAHQLIEGAETVKLLTIVNTELPQTESQAREIAPLAKVNEQEAIETWRELKETHGNNITAEIIRSAVQEKLKPEVQYPSSSEIRGMADKKAEDGFGLTAVQWENEPYEYLGECHKMCYGPRVMTKGPIYEYGVRGVYVCSVCGYAYPPGIFPDKAILNEFILNDEDEFIENKKPHVSHNSGNNEWYTPLEYIEAARSTMGTIDLDPASSELANQTVQAGRFFTAQEDGLKQEWHGKVWMNPPYSTELIGKFCGKLADHYQAGDVAEAIVLVNNATETAWFSVLIAQAGAVVFPKGRVRYSTPDGELGTPLQGQAFIYLGCNPDKFLQIFKPFGWGAAL